jgi:hypothetical protein
VVLVLACCLQRFQAIFQASKLGRCQCVVLHALIHATVGVCGAAVDHGALKRELFLDAC